MCNNHLKTISNKKYKFLIYFLYVCSCLMLLLIFTILEISIPPQIYFNLDYLLFGVCFSRYNFDRNIMYLDQSTLLICYYDIDRLGSIRKVDRDNRSSYYVICVVCHLSKPLNKETFQ